MTHMVVLVTKTRSSPVFVILAAAAPTSLDKSLVIDRATTFHKTNLLFHTTITNANQQTLFRTAGSFSIQAAGAGRGAVDVAPKMGRLQAPATTSSPRPQQ
jgi:hypothetical protein